MRKLLLLFYAILIASVANADNPNSPSTGVPLPIVPKPINPNEKPKPLSLLQDIEATYLNGEIFFVFNVDLGNVNIVITNTSTGESWYDGVNGVGTTSITLSGDEGYYEIYIYTDCGDYSGTFII